MSEIEGKHRVGGGVLIQVNRWDDGPGARRMTKGIA